MFWQQEMLIRDVVVQTERETHTQTDRQTDIG